MRILVIQTAFIGDVVLTTPFLQALLSKYPGAELHVVTTPQGCEILSGLPGVVCHALDKKGTSISKGLRSVLDAIGREARFDLVFAVHRSLRSLALGKKVRAERRIGFSSFWAKLFGYATVAYPAYSEDVHYADKPMALLAAVGDVPPTPKPRLVSSAGAREAMRSRIGEAMARGYVVLSPFSVWGTKIWFADRFAKVGIALGRELGLGVVIVGGGSGSERSVGESIAQKINEAGGTAASFVGATSLAELKATIAGARLVVANDSAPVHIAAAFNVPTVAVFGPTVRKFGFFPLSERSKVVERAEVPCRPCHIHGPPKCPKGHFRCMDEIQPDEVIDAATALLSGGRRSPIDHR